MQVNAKSLMQIFGLKIKLNGFVTNKKLSDIKIFSEKGI